MKKRLTGLIKSDKMTKSAIVMVERFKVHPIYKKRTKAKTTYMAHNEINAKIGDKVIIEETRPLSKRKSWQIIKIV